MFMFRSKKSLTKRLLRARKKRHEASPGAMEATPAGGGDWDEAVDLQEVRSGLLKKLNYHQLEMLATAVESHGTELSNCVLLRREYVSGPHVLCCQIWRWPELRNGEELRRLPVCRSATDPVYICCNPYHWSRLCQAELPPPPYSRFAVDRLRPEDRAPSEAPIVCRDSYPNPGSLTTNGEDATMGERVWCKLAYWEMSQRVGRQYPVDVSFLNIFGSVTRGDGLCLKTLAQHTHSFSPPSDSVVRTRCKIGLGITLSREEDGVWAYNRSDNPIFVNSPTLDNGDAHSPMVYRVPPGHCLCIFDPVRAAERNYGWNFTFPTGPIDPNSIRISFAKGWGPRYSRQEITACPCWLEVLLAPCR